jgi:hypothetical protein
MLQTSFIYLFLTHSNCTNYKTAIAITKQTTTYYGTLEKSIKTILPYKITQKILKLYKKYP